MLVHAPTAHFHPSAVNSRRMNTCEKCARNPRRMNTYKIIGLKVPVESTLAKKGGRGWGYMTLTNLTAPAYNAASPMMPGRPEVTDSPPSRRRAAEFLGPFTRRE